MTMTISVHTVENSLTRVLLCMFALCELFVCCVCIRAMYVCMFVVCVDENPFFHTERNNCITKNLKIYASLKKAKRGRPVEFKRFQKGTRSSIPSMKR